MTSLQIKPIEHLIVDSSAFIKLSQLHSWGANVHTISEVVQEIRNKDSRIALSVLPYELQIGTPNDRFVKLITDFAKKTGDYTVLSLTDIKLMALALELECCFGEENGKNLKQTCPDKIFNPKPISVTKLMNKIPPHQIGFYTGERQEHAPVSSDRLEESINKLEISSNSETRENIDATQNGNSNKIIENNVVHKITSSTSGEDFETEEFNDGETNYDMCRKSDAETESQIMHEEYFQSSDSDDTEGWIKPNNLHQVSIKLGGILHEPPSNIKIALLTSDFAMQNVLLQIGLHVLSIDGLLIKEVRRYAIQCRSCYSILPNTKSTRCPSCGYSLLMRVHAITRDGQTIYRPLSSKQFSTRGLRYSTPNPVGGRHGNVKTNPRNQPRYNKKRDKVDPLEPNYIARDAPFAQNDVNSRGANIGFQLGSRRINRNPNEVSKRGIRKNSSKLLK